MGSKWSKYFQYGKETTRGTLVPATRVWTGEAFEINSDTRVERVPDEVWGVRAASRRATVQQYLVEGKLSNQHGIFQQLPFLFLCGLKGGVSGSEVTSAQGDYLWTFSPSFTAANSPDSFTGEWDFDGQEWEAGYCMFKEIRISGEISQGADPSPVKIEADFFGRKSSKSTKTGSLSLHTPTAMNAKLARLYMDSSWAGIGGTEMAAQLRSFELSIITGVQPNFEGSSRDDFDSHSESIIGWNLGFTVKSGTEAAALYDAHRAATPKFFRLDIVGPQIGAGTNHRFRFDGSGLLTDVSPDGSDDRNTNLSSFTVEDLYDDTGAKHMALSVTTNTSAI